MIAALFVCPVCKKGSRETHDEQCMIKLIMRSRIHEHNSKKMGYWRQLVTQANDRAAALKHENNQLRKKLRNSGAT